MTWVECAGCCASLILSILVDSDRYSQSVTALAMPWGVGGGGRRSREMCPSPHCVSCHRMCSVYLFISIHTSLVSSCCLSQLLHLVDGCSAKQVLLPWTCESALTGTIPLPFVDKKTVQTCNVIAGPQQEDRGNAAAMGFAAELLPRSHTRPARQRLPLNSV